MKREIFCKEHSAGLEVIQVSNKTIVLPFDEETYPEFIEDNPAYKAHIQLWIDTHPELFPKTIREGWSLNGLTRKSAKQGLPACAESSPKRMTRCGTFGPPL